MLGFQMGFFYARFESDQEFIRFYFQDFDKVSSMDLQYFDPLLSLKLKTVISLLFKKL